MPDSPFLSLVSNRLSAFGANPDTRKLLLANGLRMVGYGMLDILMVLYLTEAGLSPLQVGFFLSATLFGSALLNLIVVTVSNQSSRRNAYILAHLISIVAIILLITQHSFIAFILAALTGTINFIAPIAGGFVALDQSIIPDITPADKRNAVFGTYNSIALLARMTGALISAVPSMLFRTTGMALFSGYRVMLTVFLLLSACSFILILRLSPKSERTRRQQEHRRSGLFELKTSKPFVQRLSALFAVDALATGFIAQSLIVLWFNLKFGVGAEVMGPAYSAIRLLQAAGYPLAMLIANRVGLLNTMVFTHLPSQLMLVLLPLMPALSIALIWLFVQQSLSNMDIPTRQAYIAAVVNPEERTAAAGITNMTRNIAQGISPSFSGLAFTSLAYGLPFVLSGIIGAGYDLGLYFSFRRLTPGISKTPASQP